MSKEKIKNVLSSLLRENNMAYFISKLIVRREELKFMKFIHKSNAPYKQIPKTIEDIISNIDDLYKKTKFYFQPPKKNEIVIKPIVKEVERKKSEKIKSPSVVH